MRILLAALGYRGYGPLYSSALAKLGHDVTTYVGLRQGHWPTRIRRVAQVRVPSAVGLKRDYLWSEQTKFRGFMRQRRIRYDLVLFANADGLATDEALAEIADSGMPSAAWLLDDFGVAANSRLDLRSFDHLASFNAQQSAELGRALAREVLFVPQGYAPVQFTPPACASTRALVLGAAYPSRRDTVRAMLAAGLEVDVVGRTWSAHERNTEQLRLLGDVTLSRSLSISSASRICVNGHRNPETGVSPRVFEIGGAGGLIISDNANVASFFDPGVEALHWTEAAEAAEHAVRAHRDRAFAERIAANGHRRTMSEHTIERRFATLLAGWGFS